jgi:chitodextrinase
VPAGLNAQASSPTQVNLSWSASTDNVGVTGYTVYRNGSALATVTGTTLAYADMNAAAGTTYSYTVDAFDAAGNHSSQSAPVVVTTPTPDTTPPSVPSGLVGSAASATQVNLSWSASTDNVGVTGYTVYRNGSALTTVSGSTQSYSDTTASPSTTYSYTVDAFDAAGNHSAQSAAAGVHVPALIKFVQGKTFTGGSRVTTATTTLGPVAAGDLLVGWFGEYDASGQVQVSDNVNGAWTRAPVSTTWSGSKGDIALFYVANAAAAPSGLTITVTAGAATYLQGAPAEYSGVAASNPLDQVSVAKGTGTSADSGLTAATGAGELVYGGLTTTTGPGTLTPGTSAGVAFVKRAQSSSGSEGLEDVVTSAAGQQHAGFTFGTSTPWFMVCAVFKPA